MKIKFKKIAMLLLVMLMALSSTLPVFAAEKARLEGTFRLTADDGGEIDQDGEVYLLEPGTTYIVHATLRASGDGEVNKPAVSFKGFDGATAPKKSEKRPAEASFVFVAEDPEIKTQIYLQFKSTTGDDLTVNFVPNTLTLHNSGETDGYGLKDTILDTDGAFQRIGYYDEGFLIPAGDKYACEVTFKIKTSGQAGATSGDADKAKDPAKDSSNDKLLTIVLIAVCVLILIVIVAAILILGGKKRRRRDWDDDFEEEYEEDYEAERRQRGESRNLFYEDEEDDEDVVPPPSSESHRRAPRANAKGYDPFSEPCLYDPQDDED